MGGRAVRFAVAVCLIAAVLVAGSSRVSLAAPPFNDVSPNDPAYTAINELAARDIIKGCDAAAGRSRAPCYAATGAVASWHSGG